MAYDPNADPVFQEWKRKLNAAFDGLEGKTMKQPETTPDNKPPDQKSGGPSGSDPKDSVVQDIEAPFHQLNGDAIVKRVEETTGEVVYDVILEPSKALFSAISAPLASAWVSGHNAGMARAAAVAKKRSSDKDESGGEPPVVDPADEATPPSSDKSPVAVGDKTDRSPGTSDNSPPPRAAPSRKRSAL
jgi:hypothetical protein